MLKNLYDAPHLVECDMRGRLAEEASFLKRVLKKYRARTLIDIGCGPGGLMKELIEEVDLIYGLEINPACLKKASANLSAPKFRGRYNLLAADLFRLPEEVPRVDVALLAFNFIHQFDPATYWTIAIDRAGSLLSDGGLLYIDSVTTLRTYEDWHLDFRIFSLSGTVERWQRYISRDKSGVRKHLLFIRRNIVGSIVDQVGTEIFFAHADPAALALAIDGRRFSIVGIYTKSEGIPDRKLRLILRKMSEPLRIVTLDPFVHETMIGSILDAGQFVPRVSWKMSARGMAMDGLQRRAWRGIGLFGPDNTMKAYVDYKVRAPARVEVGFLGTLPAARRQGLARHLLAWLILRHPEAVMRLTTTGRHVEMHRLARSLGFKELERVNDRVNGDCTVVYERPPLNR